MITHRPVNRPSPLPLLTSVLVTASAATLALSGASCSSAAARFTGTEHPVMASAEEVVDFGVDQPEGHEVIGVASIACETTNGASGLLEVPCTEEAMTTLLTERAAAAGGTGLVQLRCERPDARRVLQNVDGGSVEQSTLSGLVCHATVVRRGEGVVVGAPTASAPRPRGGRVVEVSGQEVEVGAERTAAGAPSAEVGELEAFPTGYEDLGRIWARCVGGCARSLARRALLSEAGRHGAQAIAELSCALEGERWRCEARMIGGATAQPAASAVGQPAPGATGSSEAGGASPSPGSGGGDAGGASGGAGGGAIRPPTESPPAAPEPRDG